ncbi:MAG: hypothetical protein KDB57_11235 [Solirubrobacterales bacterium]|nr:hypothetical protein [Solirubrobacterales bacterium]
MDSSDPQDRRRILLEALKASPPLDQDRLGIYGSKVCQACGEVGTFSGFIAAIASHGQVNRDRSCLISRGLFVAPRHRHGRSPRFQGHLFCEFCRSPVPWAPGEPLPGLVCAGCEETGLAGYRRLMVRERSRFQGIIEGD